METHALERWNSTRQTFDKMHLVAGSVVIIITSAIYFLFVGVLQESAVIILWGILAYMIYLGSVNVITYIFELLERQYFGKKGSPVIQNISKYFLWISLVAPFSYPLFILYLFLVE